MTYVANGKYSILRALQTTDYVGNDTDGNLRIMSEGLNASVLETSRRVFDPSTSQSGLIKYLAGRFRYGTDIRTGDIVRDDKTKTTYIVEDVVTSTSPVHRPDVRVSLSRND